MAEMCLTPSEGIQKLTDKILQKYSEECKRSWFDVKRCTTWVETYNEDNNKPVDFVPGVEELINNAEKHLNMVGKSFLHELPTITYTPTGKTQQTYTIIGTHIFNKNGVEVFPTDSKDRRKIFANLAVQQGRAVVVTHKDKKYVVNNRNQIISVTTGDEMKWGEENGDRREILRLAQIAFREKEKAATTIVTQNVASETPKTINIYAGTGENADLSNFAKRPFNLNGNDLESVEQGFHIGKFEILRQAITSGYTERDEAYTDIMNQITDLQNTLGRTKRADFANDLSYGARLKSIGNTRLKAKDSDIQYIIDNFFAKNKTEGMSNWENDKTASNIMKILIRASFEQNPQVLQRLLATGNATLTHTQDKGKWGTEFPKLLMEVREELRTQQQQAIQQQQNNFDVSKAEFYSGAADGADKTWGAEARALGIKVIDYTRESWNALSQEWKNKLSSEYEEVAANLVRPVIPLGNAGDIEVRRDIMQADKADAIFAIGTVVKPSHKGAKYINKSSHDVVDGGTGYAVQRGIIRGIPVYVFDQSDNQWKVWDSNRNSFIPTSEPTLTPHAATIGTRNINSDGIKAIKSVIANTVNGTSTRSTTENPQFTQFKKDIDLLSGYYEGGGRVLSDDLPSITPELDDKLNNYFMGGEELSIDDYRKLWQLMEFYDDNGERRFRERQASIQSPSPAVDVSTPTNTLAATSMSFGFSEAEMQEAQKRVAAREAAANRPKPQQPKSMAYDSALDAPDSRVAAFNRTFTPQQIKDRGAMIADLFSDIIDEALADEIDNQTEIINSSTATQEQKDAAKKLRNELQDPDMGRKMMAQNIGIEAIIDQIKQKINTFMKYAAEDKKQLYQNTLDYFADIFNTQASLDIEEKEKIRIVNLKIQEKTLAEEENDAQDDGDDDTGHTATGSDGWGFQIRFQDPANRLSQVVRSMLYDVTRPDNETDDLGRVRKYPMGQIYASLLSYLSSNMQSPDDFLIVDKTYEGEDIYGYPIDEEHYPNGYPTFPVLEKMRGMYPWVEQIIQRLTDDYLKPEYNTNLHYPSTGGRMASQMYSNFRNAFIPYGKVQVGTGNFGITPLNYQMEDRVQYDKMVANYNNRIILSDTPIYDSNGRINLDNAQKLKNCRYLEVINEVKGILEMKDTDPYAHEKEIAMLNQYLEGASQYIRSFGIESSPQYVEGMLRSNKLEDMLTDLATAARKLTAQVHDDNIGTFNYILDLENSYGRNFWQHFFDDRGWISDDSYMQSYYDSASQKTKYSYSADNYLMQTFRGIALGNLEERRAFIDSHFGKYDWFRDQRKPQGTGWRNAWLEFWYNYTGNSTTIPYMNIDNVTRKDSSGNVEVRPYTKWEPEDIWLVQNRSYAGDTGKEMGFYLAPIFSDSPMSMTVLGPKMSMNELLYGYDDKTGLHHSGAFVNLVFQELSRIKLVQQREQAIKEGRIKPIVNFDGNRGKQFCFIPELNSIRCEENTEKNYPAESFLSRMMRLSTLQEMEATIIHAISQIVQNKANAYFTENAEMYESENYPADIEHYYNMMYANAAIIQLTTIDLAFYKDEVDFQKRFKEVYAGGIRLNTNSKYGKKTENVILLADDTITSPSYTHIASIIDGSTTLSDDDKTRIKGYFTDINVADAQAIRSMDSFRSVLDMMGRWDDRMEEALNHFKDGIWSRDDFDVIYQVIKPFVYSVIERNSGVEGKSPIPVPQQHKNSEICALMMYDLITNGLNNSPVYKALSRFMDNAVDSSGEHLINMCQFESAGKVGNQGVINISFNPNKVIEVIDYGVSVNGHDYEFFTAEVGKNEFLPNDIENAESNYYAIKEQADEKLQNGSMPQEDYKKIINYLRPTENEIISILEQAALVTNPDGTKGINTEVVHTVPFDNYYQAQPTPDHSIDTEATFGSQARNISVADLPEDFKITLKGAKGSKVLSGRDAVIDFFYELLNENLLEDFFGRDGKSGLKGLFASKASLRDAITEIVRGNPKYGNEFIEALQLDDNNNFVLSPNSPTIFNLMQELVTSLFKNRITKQTINGAALIQAAGIGLDDELRLRFDKNGKFKGAECYMPLTTRKFFEPLLETQLINDEEVQVLSPKKLHDAGLDEALGYRIPTENKSSMMPLIIKGFTPLQNGSVIVLPAEITTMAGSDFDVDKMFIMLLSFYVQDYDMKKARYYYAKENAQYAAIMSKFTNSQLAEDLLEEEPVSFKEWFAEHKDEYLIRDKQGNPSPIIRKVEYDFGDTLNPKSPKDNSRRARNNMLIQMMFDILTSKEGSESVFNPQGFPDVEYSAKVNRIVSDPNMWRKWMDMGFGDTEEEAITALLKSPAKALEKFIKDNSLPESPLYPQTFAHSHAKNMAGSIQIGIYAIQASMCAKYQRANVVLKPNHAFSINKRDITAVYISEGGKRLKNEGQMVGASADNGKKPNLTDMGSTSRTASIIGYMLNAGLTHLEATLLINQPCMLEAVHSTQTRTARKVWGKNPLNKLRLKEVTTDMLIKGIVNPVEQSVEDQEAIMAVCYRILKQAEAAEYLTQVSRADSPNGAMQNTYARARIQRYKVDLMQAKMGQRDFPFYKIKEALSNDVIDTSAPEDVIREQLKAQPMAFLYGMYSLGIASFNDLVSPYFFGANKWFDDKIVKPILYNLPERMSDAAKETIISNIYTSYITYILSGSPLFGNEDEASMKSKRDYYLETFPDEYVTTIQENPDIRELLSPILQRKSEGSRNRIVLKDVGNLGKGQKQEIKRRFERLMYMDNPVARDLAEKLFMYSYYDNGLNFSHDSFAHLFTTQFLMGFPIYNNTLRELENEISDADINNFIRQFLVTFPGAAYSVDKFINPNTQVFNDGDMLIFDLNDMDSASRREIINETMSPNPLSEGENVHSYVSYNYDVYVLDEDAYELSPNRAVYNKLPKYATFSKHPLFSRQMSVAELAQEFSRTPAKEQQQNTSESPSVAPYEENTSNADPDTQNTMQAAANSMDDFTFDDSILDAPVDKSEEYTNGGESEMQNPFCQIF